MDMAVCQSNRGWNVMPLSNCKGKTRLDFWKRFPCTCGKWGNMQTKQVMDKMGLGMESSDFTSHKFAHTFEYVCPHVSVPSISH